MIISRYNYKNELLKNNYKPKFDLTDKIEPTNCSSKSQKVFGVFNQMFNVASFICFNFVLEIWTAFDLFNCGHTKLGIETTVLIFAPFLAKVSGQSK